MKRFIIFIIISLLLIFSGCGKQPETEPEAIDNNRFSISIPKLEKDGTITTYELEDNHKFSIIDNCDTVTITYFF